jgi:hypothetical protein
MTSTTTLMKRNNSIGEAPTSQKKDINTMIREIK